MVEKFVQQYARLISTYPDKISTSINHINNNTAEIVINADRVDTGKLIGKNGKMISAIKTFISGAKQTNSVNYKISVRVIDETKF